jgi:hypothetical protein
MSSEELSQACSIPWRTHTSGLSGARLIWHWLQDHGAALFSHAGGLPSKRCTLLSGQIHGVAGVGSIRPEAGHVHGHVRAQLARVRPVAGRCQQAGIARLLHAHLANGVGGVVAADAVAGHAHVQRRPASQHS